MIAPRWLAFSLLAACSSPTVDSPFDSQPVKPPRRAWEKSLPPTSSLAFAQSGRGLRVARGIIHLHSVYSHDACDGLPRPNGQPNAPCLAHLRQALCTTRQDFALLTDHADHMALTDFESLFLVDAAAGDQAERASGEPQVDIVGNDLRCADSVAAGQRVHLAVGGENELMPVALRQPLAATDDARTMAMHGESLSAEQAFHAAGGAVLLAHGESRTLELLRQLAPGLDGMEVYNLHANLDPRIRETYLGLDGLGAVAGLAPWLGALPVADGGPEPDLALLGFLDPNRSQLAKYDTLLGEGHKLLALLGSDIHENTFKEPLADGERGDSYRRLMQWFGNYLLLPSGPLTSAGLRDAIRQGRNFGVFHLFGPPAGFDFIAVAAGPTPGTIYELGDTAPRGATLQLHAPQPLPADYQDAEPLLRVSIRFVALGGSSSEVTSSRFVTTAELTAGVTLTVDSGTRPAGAYRAELTIVPRHFRSLLGADPAPYLHEYPYLYSSPIYVK